MTRFELQTSNVGSNRHANCATATAPLFYVHFTLLVVYFEPNKLPCHSACGQSYKHFTSVNYDSRVIIWAIF